MPEVSDDLLIETLAAYVPDLVVRRLAVDPTPISQPTAERFAAAVLFADISGFTALGERLAQHGLIGAEELAQLLNDCFGQLIDMIHQYGGEVTKFAGDALLALWPVPPHIARLSHAAREALREMSCLAAKCGLAMQQALQENAAARRESLSLQVGIGAGDVYSIHLGGVFDRWEFLLSGAPLVQMSRAKEQALPGKVVLSPEVWQLAGHNCSARALKQGFMELINISKTAAHESVPLPDLPPDAKKGLVAYIPAAVISRLAAGHEEWLSEVRQVTVLFIKLPSYGTSITHPYNRTLPKAQAVMQALQTTLYRYSGSINKLNVDDKGITLVAGLGLPPLSHKDDAARAIHAALEIQIALEKLGRPSAIGITTGNVFCGPIGNEKRREYTMVGNVVNMAARLMQAAELNLTTQKKVSTDLLCDENTYAIVQEQVARGQQLAGQLTFERLPALRVKGKTEPVLAYRPRYQAVSRGRSHLQPRKPACVGRESEQSILRDFLERSKQLQPAKECRVLFIVGEAGIGKSLLLADLRSQAASMNISMLAGSGQALERTTPYHAWRPVFHRIFNLDAVFHDPASLRAHVLAQLPTLPSERGFPGLALRLSPLLNPILPIEFPESEMTQMMEPIERQRTAQQFMLRLIENEVDGQSRRTDRPRLLIMDSSQWLDEDSWELLRLVSQRIKSLFIIVATRPLPEEALANPLAKACLYFLESNDVQYLSLSFLSQEQITALLCRRKGLSELPEVMSGVLARRTGGHPLYSEELTAQWLKSKLIRELNGSYELMADSEALALVPVPERIQKAITGRLDNLPPAEMLILKTASTIGNTFTRQELEKRYPIPAEQEQLTAGLAHLEQLGLIYQSLSAGRPAYTFAYGLIQEVAYNLLPFGLRARFEQ